MSESYGSWQQVAGYFDGDGNAGLEVVKYVLRFRLRLGDTRRAQTEAVKSFPNEAGIGTAEIQQDRRSGRLDAFRVEVGTFDGAPRASKAMLPFCVKKAEDLRIVVDYLEGTFTGSQAIKRFNEEVRLGRRSGFVRLASLPNTREEGISIAQLENARAARAAYSVAVSPYAQDSIRGDHEHLKLGHIRLSGKYGYSIAVIHRNLGAP